MVYTIMVVPSDAQFTEIEWHIESENVQEAMDIAWERLEAIDPCDSDWFMGMYDKGYYDQSPRSEWGEWPL